jgi:hypothetical protein
MVPEHVEWTDPVQQRRLDLVVILLVHDRRRDVLATEQVIGEVLRRERG